MENLKEIGVYIHIPFCVKKCYYCDFCSFANYEKKYEEYVEAIINEIKSIENAENNLVKTIYIGGGTPSILNEVQIKNIIETVKEKFILDSNCEITIEMNPGTITESKLEMYKKIGIHRLSIGLQSTNDKLLKNIGRIHTVKQFDDCYNTARALGFRNINVDLMIGLPDQKMHDVKKSLEHITSKNPEHISVYSLILEENTKMKDLVESGELILPDEEEERSMYWLVKKILEEKGYIHYEISNFSKKNYQSKHNTDCWKQKEYLGFGIAAHSYYNNTRYSNICDIDKYIENINEKNYEDNKIVHEIQDKQSKMNEYMILGLRMLEGINAKKFLDVFNTDIFEMYGEKIKKLINLNLIEVQENIIKLTNKGIDFANIVWEEFID